MKFLPFGVLAVFAVVFFTLGSLVSELGSLGERAPIVVLSSLAVTAAFFYGSMILPLKEEGDLRLTLALLAIGCALIGAGAGPAAIAVHQAHVVCVLVLASFAAFAAHVVVRAD